MRKEHLPYGSQWEVISAGIMIAIVPTLILFLFLQNVNGDWFKILDSRGRPDRGHVKVRPWECA